MSDVSNDIDAITLARYLSGECSAAEAIVIHRWIDMDPQHRDDVDRLRTAWAAADRPMMWDIESLWGQMASRIGQQAEYPPPQLVASSADRRSVHRGPRLAWRWAVAAAIGVIVTGVALSRSQDGTGPVALTSMREVVTQRGQRAEVRLDEGSAILLGPQSRLRFPVGRGGRERTVVLEGKAFFKIAPDSTRPFVVHAGGTIVKVLGTEFGVWAYPQDTATRVIVASGKVTAGREDMPAHAYTVLTRGDLALIGRTGRPVVERDLDVESYVGWTEGRLQFRRVPLAEVVRELERWYAVEIRLPDSTLASVPFSGEFGEQSADDVISAVARSLDLGFRRTADTLWLLPISKH